MPRVFLSVFAAMSLIVLGDTAGKTLIAMGVTPITVAWTRFGIAALLLWPLCALTKDDLPAIRDWRLWLRAGFIAGGIICILTALRTEPIADVFGVFFVGPMVSYLLSAVFLKEEITATRTALLGLGFCGVLLVVKPGFGVSPGLLWALLAGVFYGAYLTATRWLATEIRPRLLLFSQLVIGAILLAPIGLAQNLPVLTLPLSVLILASAMASAAGNFILVTVNRTTPASVVSPLIYTQLIAATIAGFVFFDDLPDAVALSGLGLILFSGLFSLRLAKP